jgi:hypothetical protein
MVKALLLGNEGSIPEMKGEWRRKRKSGGVRCKGNSVGWFIA